jgi:hypothetical protein
MRQAKVTLRFASMSLLGIVAMGAALAGCAPSSSLTSAHNPQRSVAITTTTRTTLGRARGCPPGCLYPSDYDAITVLASSATLVAIVTTHGATGPASPTKTMLSTNELLQTNYNHLAYGDPNQVISRVLQYNSGQLANDRSYVIFASYDRGGPCLSALYSFDPATQSATLIQSADGRNNLIVLPDRVVQVPPVMQLADIRARMYPKGGVVYPTDAVEWYCPGP